MSDRPGRGASLVALPLDYTVVDLETTGLNPDCDEIIELAALKVRNGEVAGTFQQLVCPEFGINEFIEELTGISNEMVAEAPAIVDALPSFLDFVGNDIVLGHNVAFDVNFIYDFSSRTLGRLFRNDFVNTIRIARKAAPGLDCYRLAPLCERFGVEMTGFHRALADCAATNCLYLEMRKRFPSEAAFQQLFAEVGRTNWPCKADARTIHAHVPASEIDTSHPLYGKRVVFTGKLDLYSRREAMQIVADFGGINENGVTKKTDYLVLGCNDYCAAIRNGKSSKQKRAEEYMLSGTGIAIMDEKTFYDMLSPCNL